MTDGFTLPSRTAVPTYHTSELVSFLDRALLDTIEVTERRGLDSDYLPWSKRALSGGGVGRRRTSRSGGPAGVVGHFVARSDQIRSDQIDAPLHAWYGCSARVATF